MKKLSIILALVLCLVLSVFSFASCGKKKSAGVSTDAATDAATTPATEAKTDAATDAKTDAATDAKTDAATEPATEPAGECRHEWDEGEENYVIDEDPTCMSPGSKSYHCKKCHQIVPGTEVPIDPIPHKPEEGYTVGEAATCIAGGYRYKTCVECGEIIDSTIEYTDIDPDAHLVLEWVTVEPTLLNKVGTKTGTCELCDEEVVHEIEWEPVVISSKLSSSERTAYNSAHKVDWLNGKDASNGIFIKKNINVIKGDDLHYYPTDEDLDGNDLLVEVSFLWNETLAAGYSGDPLCFAHVDGYDVFHVGDTLDAKERDGFTYNYLTDGSHTPSLGEYGWHRIGFRVHQDAEIDNGEVKYTYIVSLYVDGELKLAVDMTDYAVRRNPSSTVTALLYTAEIVDDQLVYHDIGAKEAKSKYETSYAIVMFETFFGKSDDGAYAVLADLSMTCGDDFVQDVEAVEEPEDETFTIDDLGTEEDTSDDVTASGKIWYKAK